MNKKISHRLTFSVLCVNTTRCSLENLGLQKKIGAIFTGVIVVLLLAPSIAALLPVGASGNSSEPPSEVLEGDSYVRNELLVKFYTYVPKEDINATVVALGTEIKSDYDALTKQWAGEQWQTIVAANY